MLAPAAALGSRCRHNAIDYWMLYGRALAPVGVPAVYKGIAQEPTTASWSSCSRQSKSKAWSEDEVTSRRLNLINYCNIVDNIRVFEFRFELLPQLLPSVITSK